MVGPHLGAFGSTARREIPATRNHFKGKADVARAATRFYRRIFDM
jgi:hypothetical protein